MNNTFKKMLMVLVAMSVMASMFVPAIAEEPVVPTEQPTQAPVVLATSAPATAAPAEEPTEEETPAPAAEVTVEPTEEETVEPTEEETVEPTEEETVESSEEETTEPTEEETVEPTEEETVEPTEEETTEPSEEETTEPTEDETDMPVVEDVPVEPEAPVAFTGSVEIKLENEGDIYFGDTVVLRAVVTDANTDYDIRWEVVENGEWTEIEGEDEETFEFVVTEENYDKEYRVVLITAA